MIFFFNLGFNLIVVDRLRNGEVDGNVNTENRGGFSRFIIDFLHGTVPCQVPLSHLSRPGTCYFPIPRIAYLG